MKRRRLSETLAQSSGGPLPAGCVRHFSNADDAAGSRAGSGANFWVEVKLPGALRIDHAVSAAFWGALSNMVGSRTDGRTPAGFKFESPSMPEYRPDEVIGRSQHLPKRSLPLCRERSKAEVANARFIGMGHAHL